MLKFTLLNGLAYANGTNLDLALIETQRLQHAQEAKINALQNQMLPSITKPTQIVVEQPNLIVNKESQCFDIEEIEIQGTSLISSKVINRLKDEYANSCLDSTKITELMSELTAVYFKKGYVTTRVYLPPQNIKETRKLLLNVDEGVISELVGTTAAKKTFSLKTAAPFLENKPLNLRDLEQALDQFNRLQSNNVTMEIQPGQSTGESIIVFNNQPTKRINGYFGYDNKGQDNTGRQQANLGVGIDNIFGLNDLLSVSYSRSLPLQQNKKDSEAMSAFYVIPFGYHTASISASRSNYDTILVTPFQSLHSKGNSESYSLKLESLIYRDTVSQFKTNIGLTTKENKAYLENTLLGVGSRKLTILELGQSYNTRFDNHFFNTYVMYQKGLETLNALKDTDDQDKEFPKAQFNKFLYGVNYFTPFIFANQNMMFSSNFSGQYALDPLYGSEQYSIGSLNTVRGFNQKTISGDHGYALKNDLSLMKTHNLTNGVLAAKYYVGLDYGKVDNKYNSETVGELSSASIGTTFNFQNVMLDFIVTQPISQPSSLGKKEADFFFSTSFTF